MIQKAVNKPCESSIEPIYETTWDDGEVEWEQNEMNLYPIYNKTYDYLTSKKYTLSPLKNKYLDMNHKIAEMIAVNAVISGVEKGLYQELSKFDAFILEINEFLFNHFSGDTNHSDIFIILLSILIGINYKKYNNKNIKSIKRLDSYENLQKQMITTIGNDINLKKYLKIQKISAIVFIIFLSIFTRNIKNAI